jgi:hypothetical protein
MLVIKMAHTSRRNGMRRIASWPAGPSYFPLMESNQRSSQQRGFFAAHGLYPANQVKPRAAIFCPAIAPACPRFSKSCYAPAAAQATIVLPDFARSLSADAFRIQQTYCKKKRAKACRKTRARESGLWVEGFFRLDFLVTFLSRKVTASAAIERGKP